MSQQPPQPPHSAAPTLVTGSYDRSLRVWSESSPSRSVAFNPSQVNCLAVSNEGRFLAAGGHGAIRVYELGALQGPHVTNENAPPPSPAQSQQQGGVNNNNNNNNGQQQPPPQPTVVDSNFTSLHFVLVTTPGEQEGGVNSQQQQQQQVLVSTSEDGHVRIWEAKGQALTISQQSVSVGCPLLCSCVTQNAYTCYISTTASSKNQQQQQQPLMLFAGSQAGILFGWNLQQQVGEQQQQQQQPALHNQQPSVRVLVNRYPISAISCVTDWYNQNQNGMIVASNTRGVVMSFWFDVDAVCNKGLLSMTHQQTNINKHKQQIIASATANQNQQTGNNNNNNNNNNNVGGLGKQSVLSGGTGTGWNNAMNAAAGGNRNNNNNNKENTSEALYKGGAGAGANNNNNNQGDGSNSDSHVFDGNAVPINQVAIPPHIFNFASIFRAHNKYIVKSTFSPSCYLQQQQSLPSPSSSSPPGLFLLATASADCTAKVWRVPAAWASFGAAPSQLQHHAEVQAAITTSDDLNIGFITGEWSIKRALLNGAASNSNASPTTTGTVAVAADNVNTSAKLNNAKTTATTSSNTTVAPAAVVATTNMVDPNSAATSSSTMNACCYWNLECTIPHQRWVWDVVFSSRNQLPLPQQNNNNNNNNNNNISANTSATTTATVLTLFTASSENAAWSWNITFSNKPQQQQPQQQSKTSTAIVGASPLVSGDGNKKTSTTTTITTSQLPMVVTSMAKTFQYTGHQKPVTCLALYERM